MKKFLRRLGLWTPAAPADPVCDCGSWPDPGWTPADFARKIEAVRKCPVHSAGKMFMMLNPKDSYGVSGGHGGDNKGTEKTIAMNTRSKPFDITEADSKNLCEAREALVKIRDSVSLILRERATSEAGKAMEITSAMMKRKEFTEYVDEIIADLESLLGYD